MVVFLEPTTNNKKTSYALLAGEPGLIRHTRDVRVERFKLGVGTIIVITNERATLALWISHFQEQSLLSRRV